MHHRGRGDRGEAGMGKHGGLPLRCIEPAPASCVGAGPRARPPALTKAAEDHRAGERGRSGEFAVDVLDSADGGLEVEFGGDALATGLAVCLGSLAIPKQVEDGLGHACHIAEWH